MHLIRDAKISIGFALLFFQCLLWVFCYQHSLFLKSQLSGPPHMKDDVRLAFDFVSRLTV